jgi:AcrR family transcriptional regulator
MTRKESQEVTRGRLLDSARRCFARDGYEGSSVDRIAADAGFSKGAFYSNFDSKESILLEILAGHHAEYVADLRGMIDRAESADELSAAMERWGAMRNQEPEWASLNVELQLHAKRNPGFRANYADYFRRYREALAELVALRFEKVGRLPPAPVEDLAAVLIALADGLALQRGLIGLDGPEITGTMLGMMSEGWIAIAKPSL